jgi:transcriptional regulator with XRE-family HTH domain
MNIGEQIKSLRKQFKISGEALGNLVGLSQQQISAIENGTSNITIDKLEKICEIFEIRPSYFWESDPIALTPELRDLLDTASQLPPDKIAIINNFLQQIALGHKPRYVKTTVKGEEIEYTYNEDERPPFDKKEEEDMTELSKEIEEFVKKHPDQRKKFEDAGFTFKF